MRRRRITFAAIAAGLLLGLYALAGFLWVPRLVESAVLVTFERDYGRSAELARPSFNPFTFEFEARSFSVPDTDGARLLGFERLYLNFELSSLLRRAWTFSEIAIEQPYLRLVQRTDGSINLAELRRAQAPGAGEPAATRIPSLRIGTLAVSEGRIDVEDRARVQRFATSLRPVTFGLSDFETAGAGNAFSFTAGSDRAGRLSVEGTLGVAPLSSKGKLALAGLPATTISEYLGDALPLFLNAGRIDLNLGYDFSLAGDPFTLVIDLPTVSARDLETIARGHEVAWQIPVLDLRNAHVDVAARKVSVESVEFRDLVAPVWMDETGFNAPGVQPHKEQQVGAMAPAQTVAPAATKEAASRPDWQVELPDIVVRNAAMAFEDRRVEPAAALQVIARELRLTGFSRPQQRPLTIAAELASDAGGEFSIDGSLTLEPFTMAVDVATIALDLRPAQAWLEESTDLLLKNGTLTSQGRLEYASGERATVNYTGDLVVAGLHTQDSGSDRDFINWTALDVRRLVYSSNPARLSIREIVAKDPYLHLILAENGVSNIQSVLDPAGAARKALEIAAERAGQGAAKAKRPNRTKRQNESPEDAAAPPLKPRNPARIDTVRILNGNVNFADFTLQPNFQIAVERLVGTVKGLSSDSGRRARLELDGEVDRYAPARIEGELNILAAQSYMDIRASFKNIELTSFTPYSGKFAGYRIDNGKLSIETKYHVEKRRLTADHQFTINQLQLGERVESADAVSLPLKLAVALLKDRNGVIDIDLPVQGSLDDPEFRLGPIIWKAVLSLLGKVVTSPFALLGKLFGGGADLSSVEFAPGSATLDGTAQEKVAALRKALVERPNLNLDIPSTTDPAADRAATAEQRWTQAISAAGAAPGPSGDRTVYLDRLKQLHLERQGSKPEIPKPPKPANGEATTDPVEYSISVLEPLLRATIVIDDADLAALGQSRAEAVRELLLSEGAVDPSRIFLIRGEPVTAADGRVRLVLSLK